MLHDLIARYGAALVFANALAASLGLPVPAMPTLIVFGAFAALHPLSAGSELGTVLVVAVCATLIGDSVWFFAGRLYGGATLRTLCKLSLSRDTCVKKSERFFGRWGVRVLAVAKLVPGLSIVSVPMAGAMGTRYRTFLTYDGLGAVLWVALGLAVGVLLAPQIDVVLDGASRLGHFTAAVIGVLALLYAGWRWMRRRALLRQLAAARIDVEELYKLMADDEPPVIFDIRSHETRQLDPYVIPGARFADERNLDGIVNAYRRNQKLVIYCSCPNEVSAAWMTTQLTKSGFTNVVPLRGGIDAWRDAGYMLAPLPAGAAPATTDAPIGADPKSDPKIV
jgi:membrane protein DedA with SNARE-associated domain/rhodanese-related sulfurtransferase